MFRNEPFTNGFLVVGLGVRLLVVGLVGLGVRLLVVGFGVRRVVTLLLVVGLLVVVVGLLVVVVVVVVFTVVVGIGLAISSVGGGSLRRVRWQLKYGRSILVSDRLKVFLFN